MAAMGNSLSRKWKENGFIKKLLFPTAFASKKSKGFISSVSYTFILKVKNEIFAYFLFFTLNLSKNEMKCDSKCALHLS